MPTDDTTSELVEAALSGDDAKVADLINAGVPVDVPDQYGWLPIHRAAVSGHTHVIALLARHGSPLEARGTDEWTPLHLACVSGSHRSVQALLDIGADVTAHDVRGRTPLHLAIDPSRYEHLDPNALDPIGALLAAGADRAAIDHSRLRAQLRCQGSPPPAGRGSIAACLAKEDGQSG